METLVRVTAVLCVAVAPSPRAMAAPEVNGAPAVPAYTGGPFQIAPPPEGMHLAANVLVGYRGADGQTTGAIATLSPWSPLFVRVGAEATPTSSVSTFRLLWGVGIESPRDRTFFARLDDWGPVQTDQQFTLRDTEVAAGYKSSRVCGGPFCAVASPMALLPVKRRLYGGAALTVTVASTWFGALSLARTVPGVLDRGRGPDGWRASYAVGRTDWHPGSLFVTYSDAFEATRLSDIPRTNKPLLRQGRGVLVAGVNLAY